MSLRQPHVAVVLVSTLASAAAFQGCAKAKKAASDAINASDNTPPYQAPAGDEATKYFAGGLGASATDDAALAKALALAQQDAAAGSASLLDDGSGSADEADTATINLLKQAAMAKGSIDTTTFKNPTDATFEQTAEKRTGAGLVDTVNDKIKLSYDPETFDPSTETIKLDADFMIPRVGQIPVKNQGQRGTCAAHAGVAELEYMVLKKYDSKISSIDLSEQRFYLMSKEKFWETGGTPDTDGGSFWGAGYKISMGADGHTVNSDPADYNVPLEADCPYNDDPKASTDGKAANELQIPQSKNCERGVVKVTSVSETYYTTTDGTTKQWYSSAPYTVGEIIKRMQDSGLPVPIAADITKNWMENDGMITLAGAAGQQGEGGHAFLAVGARKLDESKYPNEGGVCLVIKNSWGLGWGTNGYACMTAAWFNKFRQKGVFYDVAFDANVDIAYVQQKQALAVPKTLGLSLDDPGLETSPGPRDVTAPTNPGLDQQAVADTGTPLAPGAPASTDVATGTGTGTASATATSTASTSTGTSTTDGYGIVGLIDPHGNVTKALYKIDGANIAVKGILKGETKTTNALTLAFDSASGNVTYTDPVKGPKVVGTLSSDKTRLNLCAEQYAEVCLLNYVQASNDLTIGLTEATYDTYDADPNADYKTLVDFSGYGIDAALAGLTFLDFRLKIAGVETNPLRLKVDPVSGVVKWAGKEIGNYQKAELCSGSYKGFCRFVVNSEDKTLNIFFKHK